MAPHQRSGTPEELFEQLTMRYRSEPTVSQGTGFGGSPGVRVHGRIFAMLVGDALVVKLPRERVDELVASGKATRFDPVHGRVMKEWLAVPAAAEGSWDTLIAEAFGFVGRLGGSKRT
jgi:hypothetical protein